MLRLAARIFSDAPPCTPLPAAYVFGQTPDNEASALGAAAELIARGVAARLLIPESEPWGGYAGHEHWRRVLPSLGVPARCVATVPTPGCGNLNTLTEAESLAKVVAAEGWKDVLIVAPPFHLVRAFVTTASVVVRRLPANETEHVQPGPQRQQRQHGRTEDRSRGNMACQQARLA